MISSLHKVKVKNDIFFFKEKGGSVNFSNTEESNATLGNKFLTLNANRSPHFKLIEESGSQFRDLFWEVKS